MIKTKHTCREVSPGLDAPRVAGSFPNSPRFARSVRETSSHPRCVQSRTHLPASMFVILSHIWRISGFPIRYEEVRSISNLPADVCLGGGFEIDDDVSAAAIVKRFEQISDEDLNKK